VRTASFTFGRLNPPSIGHQQLVKTLASQNTDEHFLYLSHTQDAKKNPLSYEDKLRFVDELFGINYPSVTIVASPARTVIEILQELTGKYDHITMVVGSDRVNDFKKMLDAYNGRPDKAGNILYSFSSIEVVSAGDRDPDAEGVEGMSASKLRALAAENDFEQFAKGIPTDNAQLAREIFTAVRKGLKLEERKLREADQVDNFDELATKLFPSMKIGSKEYKALRAEFDESKKANKKLTAGAFFKAKAAEAEAAKALDAEIAQRKQKAISYFQSLAKTMPSDGGLSNRAAQADGHAMLLLLRSEPPTTQHARAISSFLTTRLKSKTTATYLIGVLEAGVDAKVNNDAAIRAVWTRDLAVADPSKVFILYGTAEQIAKTAAHYFKTLNYTAQAELLTKASPYVLRGWNNVKAAEAANVAGEKVTYTAAAFNLSGMAAIDFPNLAVEAQKEVLAAGSGASLQSIKEKQAELLQAFTSQLANTGSMKSNEAYRTEVYYAFCEMYRKTGQSFEGNLGESLKALFGAEREALRQAGEILGATQVLGAGKKALAALRGEGQPETKKA